MNTSKLIEAVFGGLTMILVGFVLLLNTMGTLPWSVWGGFIYLWPLLLIMGGLALLIPPGAANKFITGFLTLAIFIAVFVFGYINFGPSGDWSSIFSGLSWVNVKSVSEETLIDMPDASVETIEFNGELTTGTMLIHETHGQAEFIIAQSEHNEDGAGALEFEQTQTDDSLSIDFDQQNDLRVFGGWGGKRIYDLSLGEAPVPLNLNWELVAGKLTADLHHNAVGDSEIEVVSGDANISLTKWVAGSTLTVKLVAGSISLVLPDSSNIKVNYKMVGGNLEVEDQQYSGLSNGSVEIGDVEDGELLTVNIEVVAGNAEVILAETKQSHAE
jgi:hypothetical protein